MDRGLRLFRAIHAREQRAAVDRVAGRRCSAASRRRSIARAASSPHEVLFHQYLQWLAGTQWQDARRAHARRRSCSAICRSWSTATAPTSGRASSSSASTRRSARRPTPSARPARTGACRSTAGTSIAARGLPLAARARAAQRRLCSTATASIISSASTAPTAGSKDGGAGVLHAGRRAGAARARRARARICSAAPAREIIAEDLGHRARLRPRLARAARRARAIACSDGSATGTPRASRSAIRRSIRRSRSRRPARTTPSRWSSGGSTRRQTSGARSASCRRFSGSPAAPTSLHAPYDAVVRDVLLEALFASRLRPAAAAGAGRRSAGAIASTSRRRSATSNWTFRLPWPVDRLDEVPEARERQDQLRALG